MRKLVMCLLCVSAVTLGGAVLVAAPSTDQDRGSRRPDTAERAVPRPAPRPPSSRGHVVFIGGYFYDPFFGPYPWWGRPAYPYPYFPLFDRHAEVRLDVRPRAAAVYVDGFYAGIADDFDGIFQSLPLPPGGHTVELFLQGFRTVRRSLYLAPGARLKLRQMLEPLPAGVASESPLVAPPVPPPPDGTARQPVTRESAPSSTREPSSGRHEAAGTLQLTVQPETATVMIDGERWLTSEAGRFVVELGEGTHRLDVMQTGLRAFSKDFEIRVGETLPLNVTLVK